jgi:hypothetical protein
MMNTRNSVIAALAAATVATGAVAMTANGDSAGGGTIDLTAKPNGGAPVNVGPKGISPGDEFLEYGVLADASGQPAGRFQMITQFVNGTARHGNEQSWFTLYLKGGQLTVTGGHATTSRFALPIVGGTGTYAGAAGTLAVTPGKGETENLRIVLRANP